jgi:glutamate-5-semialdehyde dehydrogenase
MIVQDYMQTLGQEARKASRHIARANTNSKNAALQAIYAALETNQEKVLTANALDMSNGKANGLDAALLDRLRANAEPFCRHARRPTASYRFD